MEKMSTGMTRPSTKTSLETPERGFDREGLIESKKEMAGMEPVGTEYPTIWSFCNLFLPHSIDMRYRCIFGTSLSALAH